MTAPRPVATAGASRADAKPLPENASTGQLIGQLTEQISRLVRDEARLAQAEVTQKAKKLGVGAGQPRLGQVLGGAEPVRVVGAEGLDQGGGRGVRRAGGVVDGDRLVGVVVDELFGDAVAACLGGHGQCAQLRQVAPSPAVGASSNSLSGTACCIL